MDVDRQNFEAWFGTPLAKLMEDRNAGFIVVMTAFPLLERYLKAKSGREPNTSAFNQALLSAFRELRTESNANMFWAIYRHGLLHNVALSRESHGLSHDKPILEIEASGKVWMNPKLFAQRVLDIVRLDFATFVKGVPFPQVYPPQPHVLYDMPTLYYGTGMPSSEGTKRK